MGTPRFLAAVFNLRSTVNGSRSERTTIGSSPGAATGGVSAGSLLNARPSMNVATSSGRCGESVITMRLLPRRSLNCRNWIGYFGCSGSGADRR